MPAAAELAYFSSGDSLSIKDHREEGDSLVLTLRAGGEIVCDRTLIVRFAPDEVPYPEPPDPAAATAALRQAPAATGDVPYGDIIDRVSAAASRGRTAGAGDDLRGVGLSGAGAIAERAPWG